MSSTYTTAQGDTWDMISKKKFGNERYMHDLMAVNRAHCAVLVFSAGVVLTMPDIDTTVSAVLPPWTVAS